MTPFTFARAGRSMAAMVVVGVVWAVLVAAWLWLDAAWWIVLGLGVFTLPALYDLALNPMAGLTLDDTELRWQSGARHVTLDLSEIDHMRLDTRLDFSVRATAMLRSGQKVRLPFEATPPHAAFETALEARGLRVKRYHFQLLQ